jgi:transcription elongation GreA/GreB family factor
MSRAFVTEDDLAENSVLPELRVSSHPNYVTPRGLTLLQARLAELVSERSTLLKRANSTARWRLAEVDRDLRYYAARVESAKLVPVPPVAPEEVTFGNRVTMATPEGEKITYTLVGEDEADVERGLVSWVSPLSKALLGSREGDLVVWRRPAGDVELEVVEIGLAKQNNSSDP